MITTITFSAPYPSFWVSSNSSSLPISPLRRCPPRVPIPVLPHSSPAPPSPFCLLLLRLLPSCSLLVTNAHFRRAAKHQVPSAPCCINRPADVNGMLEKLYSTKINSYRSQHTPRQARWPVPAGADSSWPAPASPQGLLLGFFTLVGWCSL